jgi:hypothetical protein
MVEKLSFEERNCALYRRLDALTRDRIDSLRRTNDGDMSETKTAWTRGQIVELKKLRRLLAMDPIPGEQSPPQGSDHE